MQQMPFDSFSGSLAVLGIAIVFMLVGYTNKVRKKGPWVAFLVGGAAMAVGAVLQLLGIKF